MITREEYIAALEVVEEYHRQLNAAVDQAENYTRIPVLIFLKEVGLSSRLENTLSWFTIRKNGRPFYLDEILKNDFLKIRNAGTVLWKEFTEKRDAYIQSKQ